MENRFEAVVIGGSQAGLAAAYFLKRSGIRFVVLDARARVGDVWRDRWDSLRLFTPAKFNGLPGLPFPGEDFTFPAKDDVAQYLESYVRAFDLPVQLGVNVTSVSQRDGSYLLTSGNEQWVADNVIVATGTYHTPFIPSSAKELHASIVQLHSSKYKRVNQLPEGEILVVGAGNSGSEIAIELARAGRTVWLSGRDVGRIPADVVGRLFGGWPYWLFISRVLSVDTPIGRKVREKALRQGTPLIRLKPADVTAASVTRVPRVVAVDQGYPRLEDGRVLHVKGVVWATGFKPDFSWIQLPIFDSSGFPRHNRGVVTQADGLYFLGLHFQRALTSPLLGGVGIDAQTIIEHVKHRVAPAFRLKTG